MMRILSIILILCMVTLLPASGCSERSEIASENTPPSLAESIDP